VVCDACQDIGKPCLRIDAIQFGGFDQGVGDGDGFATGLRSDEEVVLSAQCEGAHSAFGGVVVDLKDAVIEVGTQACHAGQGISDRGGQRAFARYVLELAAQPSLEAVKAGFGFSLPDLDPIVRWQPSCRLLDGVKLSNPPDGLVSNRRALCLVDINELTPDVGEAGDLAYPRSPSAPQLRSDNHRGVPSPAEPRVR
jgi:hypothetical protein